jgi:hypothetical protein
MTVFHSAVVCVNAAYLVLVAGWVVKGPTWQRWPSCLCLVLLAEPALAAAALAQAFLQAQQPLLAHGQLLQGPCLLMLLLLLLAPGGVPVGR